MSGKRARAIRELQAIARGEPEGADQNFTRFRTCEQLQKASSVIGKAAALIHYRSRADAFTAETHTPLSAPPGWLPPPI